MHQSNNNNAVVTATSSIQDSKSSTNAAATAAASNSKKTPTQLSALLTAMLQFTQFSTGGLSLQHIEMQNMNLAIRRSSSSSSSSNNNNTLTQNQSTNTRTLIGVLFYDPTDGKAFGACLCDELLRGFIRAFPHTVSSSSTQQHQHHQSTSSHSSSPDAYASFNSQLNQCIANSVRTVCDALCQSYTKMMSSLTLIAAQQQHSHLLGRNAASSSSGAGGGGGGGASMLLGQLPSIGSSDSEHIVYSVSNSAQSHHNNLQHNHAASNQLDTHTDRLSLLAYHRSLTQSAQEMCQLTHQLMSQFASTSSGSKQKDSLRQSNYNPSSIGSSASHLSSVSMSGAAKGEVVHLHRLDSVSASLVICFRNQQLITQQCWSDIHGSARLLSKILQLQANLQGHQRF